MGDITFGQNFPPSAWIAEITGFHDRYKYERTFLKFRKDYSQANSKGSRGVYAWYILESGRYYDIKESFSWKRSERRFVKVSEEGEIVEVEEQEVISWLKSRSE